MFLFVRCFVVLAQFVVVVSAKSAFFLPPCPVIHVRAARRVAPAKSATLSTNISRSHGGDGRLAGRCSSSTHRTPHRLSVQEEATLALMPPQAAAGTQKEVPPEEIDVGDMAIASIRDESDGCDVARKFKNRRSFLRDARTVALPLVLVPLGPSPSIAGAVDATATSTSAAATTDPPALIQKEPPLDTLRGANLDCLLDLPPVARDHVRVYVCRHGQTENNRLHRVQGARVDPPLNDTGRRMAERMGYALGNLPPDAAPRAYMHSLLKRARETALVSSAAMVAYENGNEAVVVPGAAASAGEVGALSGGLLHAVPSIGEVDFGSSLEGKQAAVVRADMAKLYADWSVGLIDEAGEGGGESGREVLNRVADSIRIMANFAKEKEGPVAAVSHSAFLRMLLATVTNEPLIAAATYTVRNGCINVLDISTDPSSVTTINSKSNLFGGKFSRVDEDFILSFPSVKVVRVNEVRHLDGLG